MPPGPLIWSTGILANLPVPKPNRWWLRPALAVDFVTPSIRLVSAVPRLERFEEGEEGQRHFNAKFQECQKVLSPQRKTN